MPRRPSPSTASGPIATPGLILALLALACASDSEPAPSADDGDSAPAVFAESPAAWFNVYFTRLAVAPDGRQAVLDSRRLIDLTTGAETPIEGGLDAVSSAAFDRLGRLVVTGQRGEERGWFRIDRAVSVEATPILHSVPPIARVSWAPSGERVAYTTRGDPSTLYVGPADGSAEPATHTLPGAPSAHAWLPDGSAVLVLVPDEHGVSTLHAVDPESGATQTLADRLDGASSPRSMAVSDDGAFAYLALASDDAPDPEARHEPYADRDLGIYEVDLATGARRPVVQTPAEEFAPVFADGALHWIAIQTRDEIALVPADGGPLTVVAEGAESPTWRPDGRAIGVTTGNWRLADWALNLDGGVIELDAEGRATSPDEPIEPIITGYHEDFSPAWSPDGAWIAYHSHRSPEPVADYSSEGSTDDIYVRRPGAPMAEEVRLTDFGREVGTPEWAPDGRRLLMTTWDEGGASAWVVELDPETGAPLGRTRVPNPGAEGWVPTWAAWSPTREELALLVASRDGGVELWTLAPDGSDARRLTAYSGRWGGVDWSADGESIVYGADVGASYELSSIPRAGGEPRQLTDDPANLMHPQVSPDGRWIAASRIRHQVRVHRMEVN
ncbi:MAG: hypothetical protein ABFS34_16170 [Gemmatimonadota bacterium]